jgi:hypothetical protein
VLHSASASNNWHAVNALYIISDLLLLASRVGSFSDERLLSNVFRDGRNFDCLTATDPSGLSFSLAVDNPRIKVEYNDE